MSRKNSSSSHSWNEVWVVLVELIGFALSFYLYLISVRVLFPESVPCPRGKIFACHSILRMKQYSYIGPFSIALLGVVYYVGQLGLTALVHRNKWMQWLKALSVIGGLGFVAYLRAFELLSLHKICPWCYGVCLVTLVQVFLVYPLAAPPLPRFRPLARFAAIFAAFLVFIGIGVGVSLLVQKTLGKSTLQANATEIEATPTPAPPKATARPHASPKPTAKPTSKPKTTPKPEPTASPATTQASATGLSQPVTEALPSPRIQQIVMPAEDPVTQTDETKILKQRGWRFYAKSDTVVNIISTHPPALVLAFDPLCEECQALITKTLSSPEVDKLPVTKVAIESSNLTGYLQGQVSDVPTLMLFNESGQMIYKHVGRIELNKLLPEINKALGLS